MRFAIVIHQDPGSSYGVSVPDLPGCFSGGATIEEAFEASREAIQLHLEDMLQCGEPLPQRHPIDTHVDNEHYAGGIWGLVDVNTDSIALRRAHV